MNYKNPFLQFKGILDHVEVKVDGSNICVYLSGLKLGCVDGKTLQKLYSLISSLAHEACGTKMSPVTIGYADDEENYLGLCYKKCSLLANKDFPLCTATNTCAKDGCGDDEEYDAGLCYPKCKEHYYGEAFLCWGKCDYFCGSDFTNMGTYCYRWIPAKFCGKPSYNRGAGVLPYKPWTNGMGCNGFGVNNEGGCAMVDISGMVPIDLDCN